MGDKLATKEEAIAFAKTVGWEWVYYMENNLLEDSDGDGLLQERLLDGRFLPYTIKGFLPHHIAEQATPNPPLTFEEAIKQPLLFLDFRHVRIQDNESSDKITFMTVSHERADWELDDAIRIDLAVRHGKVYAHDPSVVPPTERESVEVLLNGRP